MTPADLPPFAEHVRAELRRGETVRWSGSPEGPIPLAAIGAILVFALFWTGLALIWEGAALGFFWDAWFADNRSKTPRGVAMVFALFGLPFVAIGFGMLASPWFMARKRRQTIYVVTSHRLLQIFVGRKKEAVSVEGRQIFQIVRNDRKNGLSDLEVSRSTKTDSDGDLLEARIKLDSLRDGRGAEAAFAALASA